MDISLSFDCDILTYRITSTSADISKYEAEAGIDLAINYLEDKLKIPFIYIDSGKPNLEFKFLQEDQKIKCIFSYKDHLDFIFIIDDYSSLRENDLYKHLIFKIENYFKGNII